MLEALKQASHELQAHPSPNSDELNSSSAINALLELETESNTLLSKDPNLSTLSQRLSNFKALIETLKNSHRHHSIQSFLTLRVSTHSISRVATFIESEIQAWIDCECTMRATKIQQRGQVDQALDLAREPSLQRFQPRVTRFSPKVQP